MLVDRDYIFTLYQMGAGAIFRYFQQIERRIEDAEARAARLYDVQAARLAKELASTRRTLLRKSQQLIRERQLNHQLQGRIRELEHAIERGTTAIERDSHNSSLPPSLDPPWKKVPRTRSLRKKTGMKVGGQLGHPGSTLRQVARPDQVITHAPEVCRRCGKSLRRVRATGCMRRQVFDIQDGRTSVIEHRALSVCCHKCGATTKAEFPSGIRAPVQYGPGVLTRASYLHLYQLLPIARTTESMHDLFGCTLAPATVERASRLFSGKLVRCEQRIKAAMDEIGILPQFKGTLVRDGYLSYTRFERCRHSLCNAHLLRELVFIEETDPAQKVWTTPLAKLLLRVKETTDKARAQKEAKLDQREQSAYLRHYDRLVRKAVKLNPPVSRCKGQPGATKKKRIAQPTAYGIIQRLQRRREEILRFMTDLSVPFDNNGSNLEEALDKLHLPYRVSFI